MGSSVSNSSEYTVTNFLSAVLIELNNEKIPYCVERNYEDYPLLITGDIDILIRGEDMSIAVQYTCEIAEKRGWKPYVLYKTRQAAHLGFYSNKFPDRFVLVIEFFTGGTWRGFNFLDPDRVIINREKSGITWKPNSSHEVMITLIHHLLYNSKVFEKYKENIYKLYNLDAKMFLNEISYVFGKKIGKKIEYNIANLNWNNLEKLSSKIRRNLIFRSFLFSFKKTVVNLYYLFVGIKNKPDGIIIKVLDKNNSLISFLESIIQIADKWHIFIPPNRKIIKWTGSNEYRKYKAINKIISSGGVVIVTYSSVDDFNEYNKSIKCLNEPISILEKNLKIRINFKSESYLINKENPESMAYMFWNIILKKISHK